MSVADALPEFHHSERHSVHVAASPEQALAAAKAVTLDDVPFVRTLFRLRGLRAARREQPIWSALGAESFQPLGADTLTLLGKPWSPRTRPRRVDDFVGFAEPGWAKMAVEMRAAPEGDGARLSTETRIFLTDRAAQRRFGAYWLVIRPFSGLTRRSWLKAAKRRAET